MPHKAFLKKKSLLDRFKDEHGSNTGYIQSVRAEHTWNNPLTRNKRTKQLNGWIKSFAGKNHIRKLSRFNAMQAGKNEDYTDEEPMSVKGDLTMGSKFNKHANEAMSLKGFLETLTEKLTKQFDLDAEEVKNYLDSHTQEMQELLDDKELSLKEKVLFVRSEITGEKDEATNKKSESVPESDYIQEFRSWLDAQEGEPYNEQEITDFGWEWKSQDVGYPNGYKTYYEYFTIEDDGMTYRLEVAWNSFNDTIVSNKIWQDSSEAKKSERLFNKREMERIALSEGSKVSPYLVEIAHKILTDEYGWKASTIEEVADWLGDHKQAFEHAYGQALRNSNDDKANVKAGIEAALDEEEQGVMNAEIAMMGEDKKTDEKLGYEKGHKNSKGEDAPWVIRSHEDNRILASFSNKKDAEEHLKRMKQYSKTESRADGKHNVDNSNTAKKDYIARVISALQDYYGYSYFKADGMVCRNYNKVKDWFLSGKVDAVEAARCLGGNCEPSMNEAATTNFPNITDNTKKILKQGSEKATLDTIEDVVADLAHAKATTSSLFSRNPKTLKDILYKAANDFTESELYFDDNGSFVESFIANYKDEFEKIYPYVLENWDYRNKLSPNFEDTYNSDDKFPFVDWVMSRVAKALYDYLAQSKDGDESKKSESSSSDIEKVFKEAAEACGVADKVTISTDGDMVYCVMEMNEDKYGLDHYKWSFDTKDNKLGWHGDESTKGLGARKKFDDMDELKSWLISDIKALFKTKRESNKPERPSNNGKIGKNSLKEGFACAYAQIGYDIPDKIIDSIMGDLQDTVESFNKETNGAIDVSCFGDGYDWNLYVISPQGDEKLLKDFISCLGYAKLQDKWYTRLSEFDKIFVRHGNKDDLTTNGLYNKAYPGTRTESSKKSEATSLDEYRSDIISELQVSFHYGEDGATKLADKYSNMLEDAYVEGELLPYEIAKKIAKMDNNIYADESRHSSPTKKTESKQSEVKREFVDTIIVPKWLWEAFIFGNEYGEDLDEHEQEILEEFKENYGKKYYLDAGEDEVEFRSYNDFDSYGGPCYTVTVYTE